MNYNELTRRGFDSPANVGVLSGPGVCRGAAGDREQGTWIQFDLACRSGAIACVRFLALACPHTIAVCAGLSERMRGCRLDEALRLSLLEFSQPYAVPIEKRGRLLIVEDAWRIAVSCGMSHRGTAAEKGVPG